MRFGFVVSLSLMAVACGLPIEQRQSNASTTNAVPTVAPPACPEQPEAELKKQGWGANGEAVVAPSEFRHIVTSGRTVMAVASLDGERLCVPLSWVSSIESMDLFENGRFLGFEHSGYESFGYTLIDRANSGREIRTGSRPHFSPDRTMVVGASLSDSGWGDLEGISIWQISNGPPAILWSLESDAEGISPPQLRNYFEMSIVAWPMQDCILMEAKRWEPAERYKPIAERLALVAVAPGDWKIYPKSHSAVPAACRAFATPPSSAAPAPPLSD